MKLSKFTDSQIIEALKRVEGGLPVPELCREYGISTATFYKWRAKYGGLDVPMMSRLKELEAENARPIPGTANSLVHPELPHPSESVVAPRHPPGPGPSPSPTG